MDRFQSDLKKRDFIFTFELVPGRSIRTKQFVTILKFIEEADNYDFFSAFTITDNPGGHPALSPIALSKTIKLHGFSSIIHLTCKDKNRNQLESELLSLDSENLHNLLVLTGDYPFYGYWGRAKPVFDLDSVSLLHLISEMEKGIELPKGAPGGGVRLPSIPFFKGCTISPFKLTLYELWWQYVKLYRKLKAGVKFIIPQVGFSPLTLYQLKSILSEGLTKFFAEKLENESLYNPAEDQQFRRIPIIPSILYLQEPIIKALLKGRIPGILLGKKVWEKIKTSENLEALAIDLCAKLTVIYQKMGFKGVHLCGFPNNWNILLKYFDRYEYYNSLCSTKENFLEELLSEFDDKVIYEDNGKFIQRTLSNIKDPLPKTSFSFSYFLNELIHYLFFSKNSFLYPLFLKIAQFCNKKEFLSRLIAKSEYFIKKLLFRCQECGDCTLWNFNYLCPQSQCAKGLLNGICGGSFDGYCEVYPYKKECFYVRVLKKSSVKKTLTKFLIQPHSYLPPRDWALYKTSSWLNFYLKKGHFRYED